MPKATNDATSGGLARAPIKVAIIDDEALMRRSLARLMRSAGIEAFTFSSPHEFLSDPVREQVDCAVTDLRMPGLDGLKLQQELNKNSPHLSLVFITGHGNVSAGVTAMKGGAVDFLEKPVDSDMLLPAVVRGAERSRWLKASHDEIATIEGRYGRLTPRERQIFALVAEGSLNKHAASNLGIAEKTVKVHRARVMEKMGAGSLAELARMAERLGVRRTNAKTFSFDS